MSWKKHTVFTILEHGAIRVLDAVVTLTLIQYFSVGEFGLFSIYQSWAGLLLLFLPSLEVSFYRDFDLLKRTGRLAQEIAVFRLFNLVKLFAAGLLALGLASISQEGLSYTQRLALLAFAMALPLSQAIYGFLREPLRFEMKQNIVALITLVQRLSLVLVVIGLGALGYSGPVIAAAALLCYMVFGYLWSMALKWSLPELVQAPVAGNARRARDRALEVLMGTVLWMHLNGVITGALQTIDVFCLGIQGTSMVETGRYAVALKTAGFFQVLPVALVNVLGVYLGRTTKDSAHLTSTLKFTAAFIVFGLLALLLGYYAAEPLLVFIGRGKLTDPAVLSYMRPIFLWQLAGVLLWCATHPLSTYLGSRSNLKTMFMQVFLPWIINGFAIYYVAARVGVLATAQANVAVYAVFAILLVLFYLRNHSHDSKTL